MAGNANAVVSPGAAAVFIGVALFLAGLLVVQIPGEQRVAFMIIGPILVYFGLKAS